MSCSKLWVKDQNLPELELETQFKHLYMTPNSLKSCLALQWHLHKPLLKSYSSLEDLKQSDKLWLKKRALESSVEGGRGEPVDWGIPTPLMPEESIPPKTRVPLSPFISKCPPNPPSPTSKLYTFARDVFFFPSFNYEAPVLFCSELERLSMFHFMSSFLCAEPKWLYCTELVSWIN